MEKRWGKGYKFPAEIGSVTIKLQENKKYKFCILYENPEIVGSQDRHIYKKLVVERSLRSFIAGIEVKHIESLKFIEGNTICTFQGTLHESKDTLPINCEWENNYPL